MATTDNPLLAPSTLPYGIPDYAAIRTEHYVPAFTAAAAQQLQEISAITRARSVPTFENTIEAWERTGEMFDYAESAIFTVSSADSSPEIQAIEEELAPLYSAHIDAIMLDEFLYSRVKSLFDSRDERDYTPEQRYLIERRYAEMTHAGAALDEEAKTRLKELNARLATLTTTFEKNLLGDANRLAPIFTDITDLDGLSAGELDAAAAAAKERGEEGYMLALPLFTGHPALASLTNRATREKVMAASRERGTAGEFSNNEVLLEIVRLRAERAELLGYASHAAYITSDETAGSPEAVHTRLKQLAPAAARNAAAEQAALQELINASESTPFELAAHDWAYYTEKVRADRYNVDTASMRPWFESERVLHDGVFFAATQLYGITFTERDDLHAYHPDARVFEVFNEYGSALGLFILDMYTRDSKRGGAWMNHLASQSHLRGTKAVVLNNLNVPKPASGPTLLTLDEVGTLFHEFGHALHGLFAVVTYPHFAGTNVFRDFVEFPSQVNEMWIMWPAVLSNYARQLDSGEPLDPELVARMDASETFNQGFGTSEYLAAAWLDQAWHSLSAAEAAAVTDVAEFEAKALAEIGLDNPAVPTRYASTYFSHIFAGGYSAGYYSYIWSEVLDADTVEWFKENGGLVRENGDRFRQRLLGVGGSKDPLEAYRDFRGRDADIAPLLKRRGLDG